MIGLGKGDKSMAGLGVPELTLTIVTVLLLLGTRKLPKLIRSLDREAKEYKIQKSDADSACK